VTLPLSDLQRWLQEVIVHEGNVEDGLRAAGAQQLVPRQQLHDEILPSQTLTAPERLGIYHGMYMLRMYDALAADYYALEHFLGDEGFRKLVRGYVDVYPSQYFSLNRLGDHLPRYIREHGRMAHREFCNDLATLELAVTNVYDGPETAPLSPERLAEVPEEAWEHAILEPVEAFCLLAFRYPVSAYVQSVKDEDHENHPPAKPRASWVAVYRRNYSVYRSDLTQAGHDLLADLVAGTPLGAAIEAAAAASRREPVDADQLFRWFREWISNGIFRSVRTT
jgi:hypothetical protein